MKESRKECFSFGVFKLNQGWGFYSFFNKKKTNYLKYMTKACNTPKKKKKNLQYRDREEEEER